MMRFNKWFNKQELLYSEIHDLLNGVETITINKHITYNNNNQRENHQPIYDYKI